MDHEKSTRQKVCRREALMAEVANVQKDRAFTASVKQPIKPFQADGEFDFARIAYFPVGHTIADVVQHLILDTLEYCQGNRTDAARTLGVSIRTLRNKLRDYREAGISIAPSKRDKEVTA